jgi:F-type H+-transporting ATPase subunit epsilon
MELSLISPEKVVFSGNVNMVIIPGLQGHFGALNRHAPFMTVLREGSVTLYQDANPEQAFTITGGFAEVTPEKCIILADSVG